MGLFTWLTKTNHVDTIDADHINALQTYKADKWEVPIVVTPEAYGAKGDGLHDDTAAIQAAIDALPAMGGAVMFSPGSYRVTSAITVTGNAIHLMGSTAGKGTEIWGYGAINIIELGDGGATETKYGSIRNLHILAKDLTVLRGIYERGALQYEFHSVLVMGGTVAGIEISECYSQRYYGGMVASCAGDGIYINRTVGVSNDLSFFGTSVTYNSGVGIRDMGGAGRTYEVFLEGNDGGGIYGYQLRGFHIAGGYYEKNVGYDIKIHTACEGGTISSCYFANYHEDNHKFVWLSECGSITLGGFSMFTETSRIGNTAVYVDYYTEGIAILPYYNYVGAGSACDKLGGPDYGSVEMNIQSDAGSFRGPMTISDLVGFNKTDSPSFATIKLSNLTSGYIPFAGCTPFSSGLELFSNGGFDSDTTGWTPVACTISSVAGGETGNCLEITRTGGTIQYSGQDISGLVVGASYAFSYYVKSGTSGNESCYGQIEPGVTVSGTSTSSWVKHTGAFVATATTAHTYLVKATATPGTMLFDTVSVMRIPEFTDSPLSTDGTDVDNSGAYKVAGVQVIGAQQTGVAAMTNLTAPANLDADTVTTAELADIVGNLIAKLRTTGIVTT